MCEAAAVGPVASTARAPTGRHGRAPATPPMRQDQQPQREREEERHVRAERRRLPTPTGHDAPVRPRGRETNPRIGGRLDLQG